MAAVHTAPDPVGIFEEVDNFEKQGDWTEERHEILEKLSMDEIAAEALRIQAEHPERYLTPEDLRKMQYSGTGDFTKDRREFNPKTHAEITAGIVRLQEARARGEVDKAGCPI